MGHGHSTARSMAKSSQDNATLAATGNTHGKLPEWRSFPPITLLIQKDSIDHLLQPPYLPAHQRPQK